MVGSQGARNNQWTPLAFEGVNGDRNGAQSNARATACAVGTEKLRDWSLWARLYAPRQLQG